MSRATRTLAERFPIRFRTKRGRTIHAGRLFGWDDTTLIEAACGGVMPPRMGEEVRAAAGTVPTCRACSRRIARPLSRSELLAVDILNERTRVEGLC